MKYAISYVDIDNVEVYRREVNIPPIYFIGMKIAIFKNGQHYRYEVIDFCQVLNAETNKETYVVKLSMV